MNENKDPKTITSRFEGVCPGCGKAYPHGTQITAFPGKSKLHHAGWGHAECLAEFCRRKELETPDFKPGTAAAPPKAPRP